MAEYLHNLPEELLLKVGEYLMLILPEEER